MSNTVDSSGAQYVNIRRQIFRHRSHGGHAAISRVAIGMSWVAAVPLFGNTGFNPLGNAGFKA